MLEKPLIVLGIGGIINYRKFTKNEQLFKNTYRGILTVKTIRVSWKTNP